MKTLAAVFPTNGTNSIIMLRCIMLRNVGAYYVLIRKPPFILKALL